MKISRLRSIFVVAVILGIAWSCQQDEELVRPQGDTTFLSESDVQGMTKLGLKLENPYSVENMKKAWENLKKLSAQWKDFR